jgi:hypothetical protein
MRLVRKRLSWLAAGWIVLQAAAVLAGPAVLYASSVMQGAEPCECPGATPGQQCPMHRHHTVHPTDTPRCAMSSALSQSEASLLTVVASGAMPAMSPVFAPSDDIERIGVAVTVAIDGVRLPDSPPPRA